VTWAKVDDQLHGDPRAAVAGIEAMGLYVLALSYMGAYLTDGEIGLPQVKRLVGRRAPHLAARLVAAGFWDAKGVDTWGLISWDNYLLSRAYVEGQRADKSRAGRVGAERSNAKRLESGSAPAAHPAVRTSDAPDPVPSRPVQREEEQTPLPPKGAQVSILGIADGSGAGEAPAKKSKKPKLPDAPKAIDLYAAAYQAGHLDAGARITLPTASGAATIGRAAGTHAVYRCGLKITGEFLIAWIRQRAADFRRHVVNPEHRTGGFSPFGFLAWLDNGHDGKPAPWAPGTEPPPVVPAAPVYRSPPVVLTPEQQARGMAMLQDAIGGR